jgi:hypothetical protein
MPITSSPSSVTGPLSVSPALSATGATAPSADRSRSAWSKNQRHRVRQRAFVAPRHRSRSPFITGRSGRRLLTARKSSSPAMPGISMSSGVISPASCWSASPEVVGAAHNPLANLASKALPEEIGEHRVCCRQATKVGVFRNLGKAVGNGLTGGQPGGSAANGAVAIEFGCGRTSTGGGSGPTALGIRRLSVHGNTAEPGLHRDSSSPRQARDS